MREGDTNFHIYLILHSSKETKILCYREIAIYFYTVGDRKVIHYSLSFRTYIRIYNSTLVIDLLLLRSSGQLMGTISLGKILEKINKTCIKN